MEVASPSEWSELNSLSYNLNRAHRLMVQSERIVIKHFNVSKIPRKFKKAVSDPYQLLFFTPNSDARVR
jgi:hypothetical protein